MLEKIKHVDIKNVSSYAAVSGGSKDVSLSSSSYAVCNSNGGVVGNTEILDIKLEDDNLVSEELVNVEEKVEITGEKKMLILFGNGFFGDLSSCSVSINEDFIKVTFEDGNSWLVDKNTYSLIDVLDSNGNTIVKEIDMYSDTAKEYNLYGGYQGSLVNDYALNRFDKCIGDIINKYFPNEEYSDRDLQLLLAKMNNVGCGYVAAVNCIFEGTSNLTDAEFYEKFGFNRYVVEKTYDNNYVKTYNYDHMFMDYFLFYQTQYKDFGSIQDIYGDVTVDSIDGALSFVEATGAGGTHTYEVAEVVDKYLDEKEIYFTSVDVFSIDKSSTISNLITLLNAYNLTADYWYDKIVAKAIENGKKVIIGMNDFTMYSSTDLDGNGKLDDVIRSDVGGHAMCVTGLTDDGGYIVSSWGQEFVVRPDLYNIYNELSGLWRDDKNSMRNITIYKFD